MKQCRKCKDIKELELFPNHKNTKDGKGSWCKLCVSKNTQKYISRNRDTHYQKMEKWRENNPQYQTQWLEENKGYHSTYYHNIIKKDELKRFIKNVRSLIYDSFKRGTNGNFKKSLPTENILGCSIEFFMNHLQSKFSNGMTFKNHGEWHIDHIIPISSAKTEEEVYLLSHYTNFQPLWSKDNLKKKNNIT